MLSFLKETNAKANSNVESKKCITDQIFLAPVLHEWEIQENKRWISRLIASVVATQQTQNICITFVECWIKVEDVGPTL